MEREIDIRTARLRLRPLTRGDIPAMLPLIGDFAVSRWLAVVPHPYTAADAAAFLDHLEAGENPLEALALQAPEGLVGVVGIGDSLGYWLGRAHHGRGYMTEAAGALVAQYFANTDADALTSGYFEGNAASANVLTKLGFVPDGEEQVHSRAQDADVTLKKVIVSRVGWEARHGC